MLILETVFVGSVGFFKYLCFSVKKKNGDRKCRPMEKFVGSVGSFKY